MRWIFMDLINRILDFDIIHFYEISDLNCIDTNLKYSVMFLDNGGRRSKQSLSRQYRYSTRRELDDLVDYVG